MAGNKFIPLKEFADYTGWGMTKCRRIVKDKNPFTIKLGTKYFVDIERFEKEVERRIKYDIPF